jgi:sugar lactone lactonase YvrE
LFFARKCAFAHSVGEKGLDLKNVPAPDDIRKQILRILGQENRPIPAHLRKAWGALLQRNLEKLRICWVRTGKTRWDRVLFLLAVALAATTARAQATFTGSQIGLAGGTWSAPFGAAADGKGDLFIVDQGNNRVVELPVSGSGFSEPVTILTGLSGPTGLAADWNGNVFVSDTGNDRVLMLPLTNAGYGTAVTVANGLNTPIGVAVDSADNVFVADSGSNVILELSLVGSVYGAPVVVSTGFKNPMGVAVDVDRTLYIADTGNYRIVKEPFTAGGYPAQQALWNNVTTPVGISIDKNDNMYIADSANKRILEYTWFQAAGRYQSKFVIGTGFASPAGVVITSNGNVYVTDSVNDQVMEVVTGSLNFGAVNMASSGTALTYNFNVAAGTVLGGVNIYTQGVSGGDFVDGGASTCLAQAYSSLTYCGVNVKFAPLASGTRMGAVVLSDANGNPLATAFISGVGNGPQMAVVPGTMTSLGAQLSSPAGLTVDGGGNVYIADTGNNRIVELPWTGSGYGPQTTLPLTGLISPMGMAVDAAGNLYVASNGNDKVAKISWTGNGFGQQTKVGGGFNGPSGVAVDINGDVYITDTLDNRVDEVMWTGSGYSGEQEIGDRHEGPAGIAVDGRGNAYFTDPYQNGLSEVPWSGTAYLSEVGISQAQISFSTAIAVDGNGNLYVADTDNNRVIMLPWTGSELGKQITVASGFNAPSGIAIDSKGELYVADTGNNQIVKIDLSNPSAMNFANTYLGSTSIDSARVALVENVGNQPLTLGSVNYPQDFPGSPGVTSACANVTSLGPSEWCKLEVSFTPLALGSPLEESVSFTSNSLDAAGSNVSIPVNGTSFSKLTQMIVFPAIPTVTYSYNPIALSASASSGLPVTFAVISGPGVLVSNGRSLRVTGVGVVVVSATQAGNLAYQAASVKISVQVAPAILTVTPQNTAVTYGSIPTSFHYSITGFQPGDSAATAITGTPEIVSAVNGIVAAGSYVLSVSQGTLAAANYVFAFNPATLTVAKAKITVAAYSVTHTYGAPLSTLAWWMSGFVNGESSSVVSGSPALTTIANSGAPAGSYPIVVSVGSLTAANYSFVGSNGVFTVQPAMLTVTAANQTMTYGGTIPPLTYWISGFMNGDTGTSVVHGAPALSTTAVSGSASGNYPIACSLGMLAAVNYIFRFTGGVLTIKKSVLQVSPGNLTMTYGEKVPALSYSLSGFVNGDTPAVVTGTATISTVATPSSRPGIYSILSSAGTLASNNYSFSYGVGAITVGKATLTVTVKPASMTYGAAMPVMTVSYSGFVNGDGGSAVQGKPALVAEATSTSSVGSYPIVCSTGNLTSQEYAFTLANGTLTVKKAVLQVVAASQSMTYGGVEPDLTYTLTGFVNGDSQQTATTGVPLMSTTATARSVVGSYPITPALGSLAAQNYSFVFTQASMNVTKATLMVTADNLSMQVGGTVPALTYSTSGWVNGETQASTTTGAPALSTSATTKSEVGSYPIVPAQGSMNAGNYQFAFVNGTLVVNQSTANLLRKLRR